MDITPQVINEVEFPLKVRGYDPDEVDDFLERMAVGVGQLQERLEQLSERAATAERRTAELEKQAKEAGAARAPAGGQAAPQPVMTPAQETEQLSRTLAMAQRFVDQAMKEAQDEADKLVADATDRSKQMHIQADVEIERLRNEAQAEIADEVRRLEEARASLQGDVEALTRHADDQRARLRSSLAEFERLLDDPEGLRTTGGPEVSSASLPDFARRRSAGVSVAATSGPSAGPTPEAEATESEPAESAPVPVAVAASPGGEQPRGETPDEAQDEPEDEDDAWARFAQGPEPASEGPPTAVHLGQDGGDPYLSELRQAIGHDAPPPSEAAAGPVVPFDQDDDAVPRRRFERR
jgi:DivIVA domain-containing protein